MLNSDAHACRHNDARRTPSALVLTLSLFMVAASAAAQTVQFAAPVHYPAGSAPGPLVTRDFDGDGKLDLAVARTGSPSVGLLRGKGDGTFRLPLTAPTGTPPVALAAADFDGDGRLDLATASTSDGATIRGLVQVLRGNGDATFHPPVAYATGALTLALAAGDLNGDQHPDLVAVNNGSNDVSVLLNNGDGTFQAARTYAVSNIPIAILLADFNGDGHLDAATLSNTLATDALTLLPGRGDGTFLPRINQTVFGTGFGLHSFTVGDFNNDGKLDIVVASAYNVARGTISFLHLLPGNGNGTFGNVMRITFGNNPRFIAAADLNDDGRLDIVSTSWRQDQTGKTIGSTYLTLLTEIDPNIFNPYDVVYDVGATLAQIAVGDFNGDGRPDVVTANEVTNDVSVLLNVPVTTVPSGARGTVQCSPTTYTVDENTPAVTITVTRTGDLSGPASVDYLTSDYDYMRCDDGNSFGASFRCDYASTSGTLTFAPGEQAKVLVVPIIDDGYAEGTEVVSLQLANPRKVQLGSPSSAVIRINDNDTPGQPNPIFQSPFFVRQHYLDFLAREPEPGEPWTALLNNCPDVNNDPRCDRITVSAAFFGSPELQLKGGFVYRLYNVTYGRRPAFADFTRDLRRVTGATAAEVFQQRAAFVEAFVQQDEFMRAYLRQTDRAYVTTLLGRYGLTRITAPDPQQPDGAAKVTLTSEELIARLDAGTLSRTQVLRAVADSDEVGALEFNRAFVFMQYVGYLRRDPEEFGYNAWLTYLNTHPGELRTMVNGFLNSQEYRSRFGATQ